jgi:hypothetical protein
MGFDIQSQQYHWPTRGYSLATQDLRSAILVSPVYLEPDDTEDAHGTIGTTTASVQEVTAEETADDDNIENIDDGDEAESEAKSHKRAVHLQTVHNRFGHRSIESLL